MSDLQLVWGFLIDLGATLIIIRGIYYPSGRNKDYVMVYLLLNTMLFFVFSLLTGLNLSLGLGLSLFAIFRVLRYRTDPIPVREMTFLFVLMLMAVLNAVLIGQQNYTVALLVNGLIILTLYIGEKGWGFQYEHKKTITYDKIDQAGKLCAAVGRSA